ncbi:hypothetical protein DFAR_3230003 [Desulfarculales bacterium]
MTKKFLENVGVFGLASGVGTSPGMAVWAPPRAWRWWTILSRLTRYGWDRLQAHPTGCSL